MIQMVSHGLISAALFLCIGVLYERVHSRLIKDYGGVATPMPIFASLFMVFSMANAGLPGTSGFVGEFLVILAAMKVKFSYAACAAFSLILGAAYTLWMYKRVMFGQVIHASIAQLKDLSGQEKCVLGVLVVMIIGLGLWPQPLLDYLGAPTQHLLDRFGG
jgi:NADH-quinone oxidoreductase subunit M